MIRSLLLIASLTASASALADVKIVVHADNPVKLDQLGIQKIFMGRTTYWENGKNVIPYVNQSIVGDFNKNVLERTNAQYKAYWSKFLFSGKAQPPAELKNDAAVLKAVNDNVNAIGFIDGPPSGHVRVIAQF